MYPMYANASNNTPSTLMLIHTWYEGSTQVVCTPYVHYKRLVNFFHVKVDVQKGPQGLEKTLTFDVLVSSNSHSFIVVIWYKSSMIPLSIQHGINENITWHTKMSQLLFSGIQGRPT